MARDAWRPGRKPSAKQQLHFQARLFLRAGRDTTGDRSLETRSKSGRGTAFQGHVGDIVMRIRRLWIPALIGLVFASAQTPASHAQAPPVANDQATHALDVHTLLASRIFFDACSPHFADGPGAAAAYQSLGFQAASDQIINFVGADEGQSVWALRQERLIAKTQPDGADCKLYVLDADPDMLALAFISAVTSFASDTVEVTAFTDSHKNGLRVGQAANFADMGYGLVIGDKPDAPYRAMLSITALLARDD